MPWQMCGFNSRWALWERDSGPTVPSHSLQYGAGELREPPVPYWKPTGWNRSPPRKRVRRNVRGGFESHGFRCESEVLAVEPGLRARRFDGPHVGRMGLWSNRKIPAWHVGDPGAIPGGSTERKLLFEDPVVQRRQPPGCNRVTMVRVHPGSILFPARSLERKTAV